MDLLTPHAPGTRLLWGVDVGDSDDSGSGGVLSYLVLERVPPAELLAVDDAAGPAPLELVEAVDVRHVGDPVVTGGDDDGVEPLGPPVVEAGAAAPAERELPLAPDLLDPLDRRVVLDQVAVAVAVDQPLHVPADDGVVAERRVGAVQRHRRLRRLRRDRLLAELHREEVHVRLHVRVHG